MYKAFNAEDYVQKKRVMLNEAMKTVQNNLNPRRRGMRTSNFLPPYSLDSNPIVERFAKIKSYLSANEHTVHEDLKTILLMAFSSVFAEEFSMLGTARGSLQVSALMLIVPIHSIIHYHTHQVYINFLLNYCLMIKKPQFLMSRTRMHHQLVLLDPIT